MLDRILGKDIAFYVKGRGGLIVCAIILSTISAILSIIPAYLFQPFIDVGMISGSEAVTWKIPWVSFESGILSLQKTEKIVAESISPTRLMILLSIIACLSVVLKSISMYFSKLTAAAFSNRAIRSLRIDLFQKFISLPLGFYHKHKTGTLISRSSADLTVMQERIANILIGLVEQPLTAVVFLIYLLMMNVKLTLLVFILAPAMVGLIRLFGRKAKKHSIRVQDATAQVTSSFQETLLLLKIIQGFCLNERQSEKFKELANTLYKKIMHWSRWNLGLAPLMDSAGFTVLIVIFLIGIIYFQLSLGVLVSMTYAFAMFYAPVKKLAKINNELRTLQGATERVFGIMRAVPDIQDRHDAIELPEHKESIEFQNVEFSYEADVPVLQDISIRINAGEMIAFVGSTGAGKSTLMDLIPRFYDVIGGSLRIDGVDVRDATIESVRQQIGIVSQEVLLFHDSIANNISCGSSEKSMEEIEASAKAAHAHDFILNQQNGYDTIVGDRGTLLSGGQKQRISIARAILTNPAILLLDEVASALDAESERFIQKTIDDLRGKKTILVVAHRLSTIRKADRIYVLENGEIIESGSFEELLGINGRFRQLYELQFSDNEVALD